MRELSGDDFGRAAPPVVWRAETGFCHDPETSAADVIRHEQEALGRALGIGATLLAALAEYPASALLWVTLTRADALRYAPAEDVAQLRLDIPVVVIATDDKGGLLLFFPDDLTQPTGGAAMADRFDDVTEAWISDHLKSLNIPADDDTAKKPEVRLELAFMAHVEKTQDLDGKPFEHWDAGGFFEDMRADFYAQHGQVAPQGKTLDDSYLVHSDQASPALGYVALDEEEQKRRAARSGGDMANPAHANLGANIRPDVGSGPGGLETYTTQKSADYRADPEQNISDYFRARFAEADRSANPPMLTLEAIADDPWNAVELPLPANAGKELLTAARSAAEYSMEGEHHLMMEARAGRNTEHWSEELHAAGIPQPDAHEYNEDRWFQAETRLGEINEALDKIEGRGVYAEGARPDYAPPITNAERDVYLLALRNHPPTDSVYEVLEAELAPTQANHALPSTEEALRALLPDDGPIHYPWPQTYGEVLEHIERGTTAREAIESDRVTPPTPDNMAGDRWARADHEDKRLGATSEPPILTLEGMANNPWSAVLFPLPATAGKELLTAARSAVEGLMDVTPKEFEENDLAFDPYYSRAENRLSLINNQLDQMEGRGYDPATQQENDASTKRQDAERAARSGETVSPDVEASVSDYFKSRQSEAKAEREGEGPELSVPDHGNGKTPGGGGGRGIF